MKIFITVVVTVVVMLGILGGIGLWMASRALKLGEATTVTTEQPVRGDLVEIVSAPGEIEPKKNVSISARLAARIVELPYDEGDRVTKGDPNADPPREPSLLVRLDDTDLQAMLRSAEARRAAQEAEIKVAEARIASQDDSIKALTASLDDAKRDLTRQKKLYETGDISESDYEQARYRVEELSAQQSAAAHTRNSQELSLAVMRHRLVAADAEIAQARDRLSYTAITSPIDGVVTRLNAEVGELVMTGTMNNPGTVIMDVADLSKMLVVARVDEADVGGVRVGQRAVMDVRAYPDERFEGVVDTVALYGLGGQGRESKEFRVEILLDNPGRKLFSGLNADVEIETKRHAGVLKVPSQAVLGRRVDELPMKIRDGNPNLDKKKTFAPVVYRLIDGKAVVTPVKVGPSDDTHTVIESGLAGKDRVIIGPFKELEKLKHDQKVKDEKAATTQPAATKPTTGPASRPTTQAVASQPAG